MARLGVLTGLRREADLLAAAPPVSLDIGLSGAEPERARAEADRLAAARPDGLVSFGLAGGLAPTLPAGALVLPTRVVGPDGRRTAVTGAWRDAVDTALPAPAWAGSVAGVTAPATTPGEKRALVERTGADIVDMESAVLAAAARAAGLPLLVVRAVCDPAHRALPPAVLALTGPRGRLRWWRLPTLVPHLWTVAALGRESAAASRSLRNAVDALGQVDPASLRP
jgi:nucleoside phosphorylase